MYVRFISYRCKSTQERCVQHLSFFFLVNILDTAVNRLFFTNLLIFLIPPFGQKPFPHLANYYS